METNYSIRTLHYVSLFSVLVLGAALRFRDLSAQGLIIWDEAKFALEGIRVSTSVSLLFGAHALPGLGKAIGTAKPTHALLMAAGYWVFGVTDAGALMVDAALSTASLLLVYLIARRLFDPWLALIAAFFLAVSEYDVLYARAALSESDATFFLLAGFYLLSGQWTGLDDRPPTWKSHLPELSAAIVLGVGFTTNYRLIIFIGGLAAVDLVWAWNRSGLRRALIRAPIWVVGLLLAPCLWQLMEVVAQAHGVVLFKGDVTQRTGYFHEIMYQLHEGKQASYHFDPLRYLQWYEARSGWAMTILVGIGLTLTVWTRALRMAAIATLVTIPYVVYAFAPFTVPRNMVAALPFAAILAASATMALARLASRQQIRVTLVVVLAAGAALLTFPASWQVTQMRSGLASAATYLEQHGKGRALTSSEIMVFYLRGSSEHCLAPALPLSVPDLGAYIHSGYPFIVLDEHHTSDVTRFIRKHGVRVGHYRTYGNASLPDNPVTSENTNPPPGDMAHEYIDVYRINIISMPGNRGRVHRCYRDEVT